jgi:hypothetical protein
MPIKLAMMMSRAASANNEIVHHRWAESKREMKCFS